MTDTETTSVWSAFLFEHNKTESRTMHWKQLRLVDTKKEKESGNCQWLWRLYCRTPLCTKRTLHCTRTGRPPFVLPPHPRLQQHVVVPLPSFRCCIIAQLHPNLTFLSSSQINVDDPRFAAIYDNPEFNIDPSAPEYKATKAMDILAKEKIKRRQISDKNPSKRKIEQMDSSQKETTDLLNKDPTLANLVRSIKAKTKTIQTKKAKLK